MTKSESTEGQSFQDLSTLFQLIENESTGKLSELAKIAGLSLANDYIGADLSNENLSGDNLSNANFSQANLSNANLKNTDLSGADFSQANLNKANLKRANLSNVNFDKANLNKANLKNANLSGANLNDAEVKSTKFRNNQGLSTIDEHNLKNRGAKIALDYSSFILKILRNLINTAKLFFLKLAHFISYCFDISKQLISLIKSSIQFILNSCFTILSRIMKNNILMWLGMPSRTC